MYGAREASAGVILLTVLHLLGYSQGQLNYYQLCTNAAADALTSAVPVPNL